MCVRKRLGQRKPILLRGFERDVMAVLVAFSVSDCGIAAAKICIRLMQLGSNTQVVSLKVDTSQQLSK
jgi:hypothetical protein